MSRQLTPARIAFLYAAFAALWIVASGYLLNLIVAGDSSTYHYFEIAKGLVFVAVTSAWRIQKPTATVNV